MFKIEVKKWLYVKAVLLGWLLVMGIGVTALADTNIPSDATYYNGHAYKLYDIACTWTEAQSACEGLGGHLITITTADEHEFAVMK